MPKDNYDTKREAAGAEARLAEVIAERDSLEAQLKAALTPKTASKYEAQFEGVLWDERPRVVNALEYSAFVTERNELKAEVTDLSSRLESARTLAEHAETQRREALAGLATSSIVQHLEEQSVRLVETINTQSREKDALRAEVESWTLALREAVRSRDRIERVYHGALEDIALLRTTIEARSVKTRLEAGPTLDEADPYLLLAAQTIGVPFAEAIKQVDSAQRNDIRKAPEGSSLWILRWRLEGIVERDGVLLALRGTATPTAQTEWRTHDGTRESVQALCGWYNVHVPEELRVERRLLGGGFVVGANNGRHLGPEGRQFVCAGEPLSVTHHTLASEG